jgi:hypothetical protein
VSERPSRASPARRLRSARGARRPRSFARAAIDFPDPSPRLDRELVQGSVALPDLASAQLTAFLMKFRS